MTSPDQVDLCSLSVGSIGHRQLSYPDCYPQKDYLSRTRPALLPVSKPLLPTDPENTRPSHYSSPPANCQILPILSTGQDLSEPTRCHWYRRTYQHLHIRLDHRDS